MYFTPKVKQNFWGEVHFEAALFYFILIEASDG